MPDETKIPPHYQGLLSSDKTRKVFGDGSFGGDYEVSPEIMNKMFLAAYNDVLHFLKFE